MGFGSTFLLADTDRGVDLYNQGKYAQAQSELAKAAENKPDDARAQRFLGLALVEQHKPAEGLRPKSEPAVFQCSSVFQVFYQTSQGTKLRWHYLPVRTRRRYWHTGTHLQNKV